MSGGIMPLRLLATLLCLVLVHPVQAEILQLAPGTYAVIKEPGLPIRGEHRVRVIERHGEPLLRHPPVGGTTPSHPLITRWDYDGFSVIFENAFVLHSVVHGPNSPQPR
jgi:hypothetical protein